MRTMRWKSSRNQRSPRFKILSVKEADGPANQVRQVRDRSTALSDAGANGTTSSAILYAPIGAATQENLLRLGR
jgi:hypothetical protein